MNDMTLVGCYPLLLAIVAVHFNVASHSPDAPTCETVVTFAEKSGVRFPSPSSGFPTSGNSHSLCKRSDFSCCTSQAESVLYESSKKMFSHKLADFWNPFYFSLSRHAQRIKSIYQKSLLLSRNMSITCLKPHLISEGQYYLDHIYYRLDQYLLNPLGEPRLQETMNRFLQDFIRVILCSLHKRTVPSNGAKQYCSVDDCVLHRIIPSLGEKFTGIATSWIYDLRSSLLLIRAILNALEISRSILKTMEESHLQENCWRNIMQMGHCSWCAGLTATRPCHVYCLHVFNTCLQPYEEKVWKNWIQFIDEMEHVIVREQSKWKNLLTISKSMPSALVEIFTQIVQSLQTIQTKIPAQCPHLIGIYPHVDIEHVGMREFNFQWIHRQVNESLWPHLQILYAKELNALYERLSEYKKILSQLSSSICSNPQIAATIENRDKCWNGTHIGRFKENYSRLKEENDNFQDLRGHQNGVNSVDGTMWQQMDSMAVVLQKGLEPLKQALLGKETGWVVSQLGVHEVMLSISPTSQPQTGSLLPLKSSQRQHEDQVAIQPTMEEGSGAGFDQSTKETHSNNDGNRVYIPNYDRGSVDDEDFPRQTIKDSPHRQISKSPNTISTPSYSNHGLYPPGQKSRDTVKSTPCTRCNSAPQTIYKVYWHISFILTFSWHFILLHLCLEFT